jgi:Salmonella virulence plasmid 65kDa B protein/FG-GAP-like repeat
MSNKSGVSQQVISLPKGGGAQHGIGEKFAPDLHTGTGNFTVPIALPSGRNGFQPQLSLVYSTGNGNGVFGLGWGLSIPGVSRQTSKGIPRYDDAKDIFILSGAEDLVSVEQQPGVTRYQPRTEGLFAKIFHHRDANNNYWEVRSKDGLVSQYGTPATVGNDPAAIAKPTDCNRVFAWNLTRTTDLFGNRIDYLYERDAVQMDGAHHWDQLYLSEIRYVDYGDSANPQFLVRVKFTYETRPDPFSEYRAGFEIRTIRRCTKIEVFTSPGSEILTRTYRLIYLDQRGFLAEQLPLNSVSLLSQVRVEGHDEANPDPLQRKEILPPLEFSYSQFKPQGRDFFPVTGADLPPGSLARPEYELADLFGNGLPDILEMNGTVRYWRNLGNGRFDRPREMKDAPAGLQLADPGVQLIDADGDGRIDLLVTTLGLSGYFPLRFGGLWDRKSFQRYEVAPSTTTRLSAPRD